MNLPWELVIEILLRLPVRSLIRFRSVCKAWLSLICDPHFAKSHFELATTATAAALTQRLLFIGPSSTVIRSIDLNPSLHDDSASVSLKVKFLSPKPFFVRILGSCRGFILFNCNRSRILCLWNPSTDVHKFAHWSPLDFRHYPFLCALAYDPSTDDYLVVQASHPPRSGNYATCMEFFSVRANAWKQIETKNLSYRKCSPNHCPTNYVECEVGSVLNGAIHWLAFNCNLSTELIVTFDVTEKSFSEILLPLRFNYSAFQHCLLGVRGELLSLSAVWYVSVEIWVMKEYKVQSSWTRNIVVSYDSHILRGYFFPICSTKNGDIVGTDNHSVLAKCNDKGQMQEERPYCELDSFGLQLAVYTESLLSLPCNSVTKLENKTNNNLQKELGLRYSFTDSFIIS